MTIMMKRLLSSERPQGRSHFSLSMISTANMMSKRLSVIFPNLPPDSLMRPKLPAPSSPTLRLP